MEIPQLNNLQLLCYVLAAAVSCMVTLFLKLSTVVPYDSHGTTAVAHRCLPFVTVTDGVFVWVRVRGVFAAVSYRPTRYRSRKYLV